MNDLVSRSQLLKAFNNKNIQITFDLPVEEVLGEDVDLDDFAMLVQDAIQAYKKMVIDTIKNHPTAYDPDKVVPLPLEDWSEDYGDCLWWRFPIEEPPYCGNPLDSEWQGKNYGDYYTHFTRLIIPELNS